MSDIAAKVKAIIIDKLGVDEKEVTPEASFTNDLGADSTLQFRMIRRRKLPLSVRRSSTSRKTQNKFYCFRPWSPGPVPGTTFVFSRNATGKFNLYS